LPGLIRYIGPVKGLGRGHWFGIEMTGTGEGNGNSDGQFGHTRYFHAPPCSSIFVTADKLIPQLPNAAADPPKKVEEEDVERLADMLERKARMTMEEEEENKKYDRLEFRGGGRTEKSKITRYEFS
jgi:dynactin complex subunit